MNITDPIWQNAMRYPEREAVFYDGKVLPFATLCRDTERVAFNLRQAGIESGQRVVVRISNPVLHVVVLLALARMGAISTPAAVTAPPEMQADILRQCGATAYVRNNAAWKIDVIPEDRHFLTDRLTAGNDPPPGSVTASDGGDRVWRIGLSSGTTGMPKGIAWTHEQTARLAQLTMAALPSGPAERLLMFLDLTMMYSLNQMLRQLYAGGALSLPTELYPAELFRSIRRDHVTQVMTANAHAWNAVQYVPKATPEEILAARRVGAFVASGSAMQERLRTMIRERICPNLYIHYGSSEAGLIARADPISLLQHPDSAGYLMPWVEAETVDEEGRALPKGTAGILRFRVPATSIGYEGDPEATAKAFKDGWFYPGDTGSVDGRGLLKLGARADDIINMGGTKIDPTVIEAVLNEDPAVAESVVLMLRTEQGMPILVGIVVQRQPINVEALRAQCKARLGDRLTPMTIVATDRLPRNAEGKIQRRELAAKMRVEMKPTAKPGDAGSVH